MKYSNLVHNILNIAIATLSGVTAYLLATGCVETASGIDCTDSALSPTITVIAVGFLSVAKFAINVIRDGLKGLVKEQPPVQ